MIKLKIIRKDGEYDVIIIPHKLDKKYSFVNLTKGHICPCKFNTIEEAIDDLNNQVTNKKVISYKIM